MKAKSEKMYHLAGVGDGRGGKKVNSYKERMWLTLCGTYYTNINVICMWYLCLRENQGKKIK